MNCSAEYKPEQDQANEEGLYNDSFDLFFFEMVHESIEKNDSFVITKCIHVCI